MQVVKLNRSDYNAESFILQCLVMRKFGFVAQKKRVLDALLSLDDGGEPLAAVAHLHDALTAVAVFQQLGLCLPQHLFGQHAGACAEVIYSCHNQPLLFL